MSSGSERDPLCGVIVQSGRIVGAISIPDDNPEFIEEFNNCYGPIRLHCSSLEPEDRHRGVVPKYRHRLPTWYREAWIPKVPPQSPTPSPPPTLPTEEPRST